MKKAHQGHGPVVRDPADIMGYPPLDLDAMQRMAMARVQASINYDSTVALEEIRQRAKRLRLAYGVTRAARSSPLLTFPYRITR